MSYGSATYGISSYGVDADDGWITPVTDRVLADCVYGNPKGCLDATTLNRIENNVRYISTLLATVQHASIPTDDKVDWDRTNYIYVRNYDRIKAKINALRDSGIINSNTPTIVLSELPWAVTYLELNAMEQILLDIKNKFSSLANMYRISGTFSLGNDYVLQVIRRG